MTQNEKSVQEVIREATEKISAEIGRIMDCEQEEKNTEQIYGSYWSISMDTGLFLSGMDIPA